MYVLVLLVVAFAFDQYMSKIGSGIGQFCDQSHIQLPIVTIMVRVMMTPESFSVEFDAQGSWKTNAMCTCAQHGRNLERLDSGLWGDLF